MPQIRWNTPLPALCLRPWATSPKSMNCERFSIRILKEISRHGRLLLEKPVIMPLKPETSV